MVFETESDLDAFRTACAERKITFSNRLISLDGWLYNFRQVRDVAQNNNGKL